MERTTNLESSGAGPLIVLASALMGVGLLMVLSTTMSLDHSLFDRSLWQTAFGRQVGFAGVGLFVILAGVKMSGFVLSDAGRFRLVGIVLLVVTLVALVAAFVPPLAEAHRGSYRWIRLGATGIVLQPSALAKLGLVFFLAVWLGQDRFDPRSLGRGFLPAAGAIGVCVLLVGKEDFGTAALLAAVGGAMLVVGGCRWLHVMSAAGVGVAALAGLLVAEPYRLGRLTGYLDIWSDPLGRGYQPLQSMASIVTGGWTGVGIGRGIQKFGYLPDAHTDFVFATICEEMGLIGGGLVLAMFVCLVFLGYRAMRSARTRSESVLAFGITAMIGLQAAMHIAVATVVTPTTGISLPLISAGGSGLISFCMMLAVLGGVAARAVTHQQRTFVPARRASAVALP